MIKSLHFHTAAVYCALLAAALMLPVPYATANPSFPEALQAAHGSCGGGLTIEGGKTQFEAIEGAVRQ